ncbi:DEAD/DEAH box helicase family protein [Clostridium chromiireducens]|uniref:ATP-dependent RNA helicase DbpA n=1 Tax=Clostridium chromiireducens TaxID=225345 RepID=A0A1V4I9B3_9CLOT|nr:DEAD/DEAH box helicase family protein [Clostridium chromiireducens]OPJ56117.1 ATP-dependent RNA helicase DbpA [Clostridium chromiireducens]
MSLSDLNLRIQYRSDNEYNIVKDFYIPTLSQAITYKRAVGFFSSSALSNLASGISELIKRNGRMKLIVSERLTESDIEAIKLGYKKRENVLEESMMNNFHEPSSILEEERLNYLANLIANNRLDIKVAIIENKLDMAMYHEKIGIIIDEYGNKVAFTGSLNESEFAYEQNFESIDVYCSWKNETELERAKLKELNFDSMWNDETRNLKIYNFPEAVKRKILRYRKNSVRSEMELISKNRIINESIEQAKPVYPEWFKIRDYQKEAISKWRENKFIGLLNMATGTGKTLTALSAVKELSDCIINEPLLVIIVCPYTHLVEQWKDDVISFNISPIIAYSNSDYKNWEKSLEKLIYRLDLEVITFGCVLTTNSTYKSANFQNLINTYDKNILLVIDEAHNAGAYEFKKVLLPKIRYRLALSATPARHFDDEGTKELSNYFGGEIYSFDLKRAIDDGFLTKYYYYPEIISLTDDERKEYAELSKKIAKAMALSKKNKSKSLEMLLIKRARILASAENKLTKLRELMKDQKDTYYNLVYCGAVNFIDHGKSVKQIDKVCEILGSEFDMKVAKFTSEESSDERKKIIQNYKDGESLQVIVAIKCLDEGVNIPSIRNAYILASSSNPREFIQRRGRVLRKFEGKDYAYIYDFIVLPRERSEIPLLTPDEIKCDKSMIKREFDRVEEFAKLAQNKNRALIELDPILEYYNLFE